MATKETAVVFTHTVLMPILGKPTYDSMVKLRQELFANAGDVARQHGPTDFVGCIMDPTEFVKLYDTEFQPPEHPGPFNANPADPQAVNLYHLHKELMSIYQQYARNEQHLKWQLIEAVPSEAIASLCNRCDGFLNVSMAALFAHLMKEYGTITHYDVAQNHAKLLAPWETEKGIQDLWTWVDGCKQMAIDGDTSYTERQLIGHTLKVFQDSGVFGATVEAWLKKPDATWTWDAFYGDFKDANNALGQTAPAKSTGYQTANAATKSHETTFDASTLCLPVGAIVVWYCTTHGFSLNPGHTSATCTNPGEKHNNKATATKHPGEKHNNKATATKRFGGVNPFKLRQPRKNSTAAPTAATEKA